MNTQQENIEDLLRRYRLRLSRVYIEPNHYYVKGKFPTEYQEIKEWIKKLEKINK